MRYLTRGESGKARRLGKVPIDKKYQVFGTCRYLVCAADDLVFVGVVYVDDIDRDKCYNLSRG